ncbi:MAG TPA: hypothetical protein VGP76_06145 [Planctomycetaceae bacterium]|nr:hypothetical protein [Planctomycetaceae bacterium]
MAASFAWSKAIATLKKQLGGLGMEFVGEMLGRTDLDESSNPITDIREDEAIHLAEQLGMISTTEAIRLRTSQTLVSHFLDPDTTRTEQMYRDEAVSIVRSCVVNFLADPNLRAQQPFLELRDKLESLTLNPNGPEAASLSTSPYFFIRTTLTVLLAQLKVASGAKLEHAAGNIGALLPAMWAKLRDKDRWQTGETYALLQSANRTVAATGMRAALMNVKGFDYVPENLRSETFRAAARAVLNAHFGFNNFYNELKPMETLLRLGSSIPGPAVDECFSAALCVRLGNPYGVARSAQGTVEKFLRLFRQNQWGHYINKVLPTDTYILEKLALEDAPLNRWIELVAEFGLESYVDGPRSAKLVSASISKANQIKSAAHAGRQRIMQ